MILSTKAQEKHLTPEYISALKVDSWIFLSLKGLTKSVITFDTALFAVFKAEYPTPVSYNSLEKLTHYLQMWFELIFRLLQKTSQFWGYIFIVLWFLFSMRKFCVSWWSSTDRRIRGTLSSPVRPIFFYRWFLGSVRSEGLFLYENRIAY